MTTYTVIDADTHITEPADVWTSRVPRKFVDRVPHVERDRKGRDMWVLDGERLSHVGLTAPAGHPEPFPSGPATYEECHPASYDAQARLQLMDGDGIWAQVIYPNVGGFGSQKFLALDDEELKLACVQAYNDFQRDWVSPDPRRFVTMIATPFWDIRATVAEIERGAAAGHRGILFTGEPDAFGLPVLGDKYWDPLWQVATETGLPVHFHIGSGDLSKALTPSRAAASGIAASYAFTSIDLFMRNGIQVADLLLCGVLPRFPAVKFVSVESGIGWLPFVLEACDYHIATANVEGRELFEELPSHYFRRQVYSCYWFEDVAPSKFLDIIPAENILFETDFPHPTCLYGNVAERIESSLGDQPEAVRRRILWDNAAELYRIEAPVGSLSASG